MTDLVEPIPGVQLASHAHRGRGYLAYLAAATLFSINGTVAKTVMLAGLGATQLSQLRVTGAAVLMLAGLAVTGHAGIRLRRREIPLLLVYGILGVAATQSLYFISITTLPIGVALLVEFTAPLLVTLWLRFVLHRAVKPLVWVALVIALAGLAVVAQVWDGFTLDPGGFAASVGAAATLAVYFVTADIQVKGPGARDPVSLTAWGMTAAALFWAVAQPWWGFPAATLSDTAHLLGDTGPIVPLWALCSWIVIMGTIVPFSLVVVSVRHLSASQASTVGMVEPVIATGIAWFALGEVLAPVQLVGAAIVLGGVVAAERNR